MKTALLPLAALLAIVVAPASNTPASAAGLKPAIVQDTQAQDISAARKYHHHYRHYSRHYSRGYVAPRVHAYAAPRAYGWQSGDPGARPDSLLSFYRRNHICAIDEGYGRATRCD